MAKQKVPKKIAGVKVPKPLRRSTWLKSLVGNKAGRSVLTEALLAAAGAAAVALTRDRSTVPPASAPSGPRGDERDLLNVSSDSAPTDFFVARSDAPSEQSISGAKRSGRAKRLKPDTSRT
jgi:hypothetical protein